MASEGYDVAVNEDKISELLSVLSDSNIAEIDQLITDIYTKIDEFQEYWEGASFTTFSEKCHSYEEGLRTLPKVLTAFQKLIVDDLIPAKDTLCTEVENQLEIMKGA